MSTIGANFFITTPTPVAGARFQFSYANVKAGANESADTDAFLVIEVLNGYLYYNANSTASPNYQEATVSDSMTGSMQIRLAGNFLNNVKLNGTSANLTWSPRRINSVGDFIDGNPEDNASGVIQMFRVRAVDNINGIFGDGDDTVSTDSAIAQINLPVVASPSILFRSFI